MLQNLLYVLLVSGIAVVWGLPVLFFQQKQTTGLWQINRETILFSFFAGLILIGLASSWLSLFMGLNYIVLIISTTLLFFLELLWFRKARQRKKLLVNSVRIIFNAITIFFFCAILLFIFLGSSKPVMEDTDLYHIQIIRWNQQYGTVPGVANLYLRYGFFSNWFHLISLFSFPFKHQNFLFLNITLAIWLVFFLLHKLQFHFLNQNNKANRTLGVFYFLILTCMFIEWDLLRGTASSTSYDFIVTSLLLMALLLVIEVFLLNNTTPPTSLIAIFCIAAPFFKITGAPALIILFVYFLLSKQSLKKYFFAFAVFLLFFIPYLVKNYIQTGYFLFPYSSFPNTIKPDWQVPKELLTRFTDFINLGNKYINHSTASGGWEHLHQLFFAWIPIWIRHLTLFDKIISVLVAAGILLSFFVPVFKHRKLRIIYYSCALIIPFWFFTAPDHRFAYGLTIFLAFLPLSYLSESIVKKKIINASLLLTALIMVIYIFPKTKNFYPENLVHPPPILIPPYQKINIANYSLHLPEKINGNWNSRCYDTPLPCLYQLNPYLEARGKELKDGFRMKPITDSSFILNFRY